MLAGLAIIRGPCPHYSPLYDVRRMPYVRCTKYDVNCTLICYKKRTHICQRHNRILNRRF